MISLAQHKSKIVVFGKAVISTCAQFGSACAATSRALRRKKQRSLSLKSLNLCSSKAVRGRP